MWVPVCKVGDLAAGAMDAFAVPGLAWPVLVANLGGGDFAASTSVCPHEDVLLVGGALAGRRVTCPGHGYEFDLVTGRCSHDPSLRLRRFPVRVVGDEVQVLIDLVREPG